MDLVWTFGTPVELFSGWPVGCWSLALSLKRRTKLVPTPATRAIARVDDSPRRSARATSPGRVELFGPLLGVRVRTLLGVPASKHAPIERSVGASIKVRASRRRLQLITLPKNAI